MTSQTEGLGTSILDAFACQVPVVATAAGGIPELVIDRHTGMLCPIKDPENLAKAVLEVYKDTDLRKQLVKNASNYLLSFTKELMADKVLKVYKGIMDD